MYKFLNELKKADPEIYGIASKFNQDVLTICGKIDARLKSLSPEGRAAFMKENSDFFDGFAWTYYTDWRKQRAESVAHIIDICDMLNVKFKPDDFVGETFYAGIPPVNSGEIKFAREKIGNDGLYHQCDEYGDFI